MRNAAPFDRQRGCSRGFGGGYGGFPASLDLDDMERDGGGGFGRLGAALYRRPGCALAVSALPPAMRHRCIPICLGCVDAGYVVGLLPADPVPKTFGLFRVGDKLMPAAVPVLGFPYDDEH